MITYIGTPAYTSSITIPSDGDLASAASVNNPTKSEADMDYFILQAVGNITQGSPITLYSDDLATVNVGPISLAIVTETGLYTAVSTNAIQNIGTAQLETGVNYVASTWYYIYIYSVAGVAAFQISTTPPDTYRQYKATSTSHKYIGSFKTNGGGQIVRFYAIRGVYQYLDDNAISTGNATTETVVATNAYVPPTSRLVNLHLFYDNIAGATSSYQIITTPTTAGISFVAFGSTISDLAYQFMTYIDQTMRYKVGNTSVSLSISVAGYTE